MEYYHHEPAYSTENSLINLSTWGEGSGDAGLAPERQFPDDISDRSSARSAPYPKSNIYKCEWTMDDGILCNKAFFEAEQLYNHLCEDHVGRKTTNNLCLTCRFPDCLDTPRTYSKRDHITSHLRSHVAIKPHVCERCSTKFKWPHDLKKHQKLGRNCRSRPSTHISRSGSIKSSGSTSRRSVRNSISSQGQPPLSRASSSTSVTIESREGGTPPLPQSKQELLSPGSEHGGAYNLFRRASYRSVHSASSYNDGSEVSESPLDDHISVVTTGSTGLPRMNAVNEYNPVDEELLNRFLMERVTLEDSPSGDVPSPVPDPFPGFFSPPTEQRDRVESTHALVDALFPPPVPVGNGNIYNGAGSYKWNSDIPQIAIQGPETDSLEKLLFTPTHEWDDVLHNIAENENTIRAPWQQLQNIHCNELTIRASSNRFDGGSPSASGDLDQAQDNLGYDGIALPGSEIARSLAEASEPHFTIRPVGAQLESGHAISRNSSISKLSTMFNSTVEFTNGAESGTHFADSTDSYGGAPVDYINSPSQITGSGMSHADDYKTGDVSFGMHRDYQIPVNPLHTGDIPHFSSSCPSQFVWLEKFQKDVSNGGQWDSGHPSNADISGDGGRHPFDPTLNNNHILSDNFQSFDQTHDRSMDRTHARPQPANPHNVEFTDFLADDILEALMANDHPINGRH